MLPSKMCYFIHVCTAVSQTVSFGALGRSTKTVQVDADQHWANIGRKA